MNRTRSMGMRSLKSSLQQPTGVEARPVQAGLLDDTKKAVTHVDAITPDVKAVKLGKIEARANIAYAYRHMHRPVIRNLY